MKLTLSAFLTLDGVMQAPGARDEDLAGGFAHGGWQVPYFDEELLRIQNERFAKAEAFLLGRRTYEIFAAYWPKVTGKDNLIADRLNTLPKYVVSRTLRSADWRNSTLLAGDVVQQVTELKRRPGGELQIHGSGRLAQTLAAPDAGRPRPDRRVPAVVLPGAARLGTAPVRRHHDGGAAAHRGPDHR